MSENKAPHKEFGEFFQKLRMATGLSLRVFCNTHGLDPSNTSKIERGLMTAPRGETLDRYAGILGLEPGTDSWFKFKDLAAAAAGIIPDDIMSDEQALRKMPVLFRAAREGDLEELLRRIKKT